MNIDKLIKHLERRRALLRSSKSWTTTDAAKKLAKIEEITEIIDYINTEL